MKNSDDSPRPRPRERLGATALSIAGAVGLSTRGMQWRQSVPPWFLS